MLMAAEVNRGDAGWNGWLYRRESKRCCTGEQRCQKQSSETFTRHYQMKIMKEINHLIGTGIKRRAKKIHSTATGPPPPTPKTKCHYPHYYVATKHLIFPVRCYERLDAVAGLSPAAVT